ncbi:hypothetical protein [Chitinophaga sp. OAE865]|uniref:hypothetical protein n=1 Tax=Chitinophaga sp. OAE865 TaxID=2817898 RepID=UPI001AE9C6FF
MNKRSVVLYCFILTSLSSCGQAKTGQQVPVTRSVYNSISQSVRTFDYNPTYQVRFTNVSCSYEIFVNDMLVTFSFSPGNTAGEQSADIPQYILKSGPQELKIKLYPEAGGDGNPGNAFNDNSSCTARIVHGDYEKNIRDNYKEVLKIKSPVLNPGVPGRELKGSFTAKVPYTLQGWSAGADLKQEDKAALTKEVVAVYQQFIKAFENKDVPAIASMIYNREKEIAQAFFFVPGKPNSYDQGWEKLEKEVTAIKSIQLVKGYELRYSGDGKVVALLQPKGTDRDYPAIEAETEDKYSYYALYLYRPAPGSPLRVIR